MSDKEDGWDLATCDPELKEVLVQFDYDGNGFVSKDEVAKGADLYVKEQKITKKQKKQMHWLFATIVCLFLLSGGLAVGLSLNTVHKIDANKDTLVDPSSGKMMVKNSSAAASLSSSFSRRLMSSWREMLSNISPSSSSSTRHLDEDDETDDTSDMIVDVATRSYGSNYSPEVIEGTNCYSQEAVTGMFVSVATGVTTTLTETNQTTNAFHVNQLGTSDCPDSDIVWSEDDVRLGCVVMVPSLDCTNMARRDRHLSELDDEDALHDHHRSLKEHVVNIVAGGGGTAVNHNHRNLKSAWWYVSKGYKWGHSRGYAQGLAQGRADCPNCPALPDLSFQRSDDEVALWHTNLLDEDQELMQDWAQKCMHNIDKALWSGGGVFSRELFAFQWCFKLFWLVGGCGVNNPLCICPLEEDNPECRIDQALLDHENRINAMTP